MTGPGAASNPLASRRVEGSAETPQVCDCPMDDKMGVAIHRYDCEYAEWLGGLFRDGE